jgi:hypothetical protein
MSNNGLPLADHNDNQDGRVARQNQAIDSIVEDLSSLSELVKTINHEADAG